MIPNCELRLKSLLFNYDFNEKFNEFSQNLSTIKAAIVQVRESVKLKNIIEVNIYQKN